MDAFTLVALKHSRSVDSWWMSRWRDTRHPSTSAADPLLTAV